MTTPHVRSPRIGLIATITALLAAFAAPIAFADDVQRLTIATKRFGGVQLMTVGVDGSNPTQLTNDPDDASQPTWCPDGTKVAYVAGPRMQGKIKIMDGDGSNVRVLYEGGTGQRTPQWSPDGKQIAFSMREPKNDNNFNIFAINIDGTRLKNLTDESRFAADPAWSPDGKKIAYATENPSAPIRLWVMNADGSEKTDVLGRALWIAVYPSFSRDGKQIVYGSSTRTTPCQVMQVNLDGKGDTAMTDGPLAYSYAEWSPDGNLLAYASDPGHAAGDLCVYDVLAGEHRTILKGEVFQELFRDARPSWVPQKRTKAEDETTK
jgi:Tol biopolymer transport system component